MTAEAQRESTEVRTFVCGARPDVFDGSPCGYGKSHPIHTADRGPLGIPFTEKDRHPYSDPYEVWWEDE